MGEELRVPLLKLLVIIVDREQKKRVKSILKEEHVHIIFECLGEGTAASEILDLLGLGAVDKSVLLCLQPDFWIDDLLHTVTGKMQMKKPGTGIAFILPLSGFSNPALKMLDADVREKLQLRIEKEVEKMKSKSSHDLILAIINQGYTEELMTAARDAGATGGTVIHARGIALDETVKFFGISVQPEKEIVLIVTAHEAKQQIMQAICSTCGMKTEAKGIAISLPVDSVSNL